LVFYSSVITMMHGSINIRYTFTCLCAFRAILLDRELLYGIHDLFKTTGKIPCL